MRSTGHIVGSSASDGQNINALFFMLGWARCRSYEKCAATRYTELVFLYLVGYVGHVVHSSAIGCEMSACYFSCSCGPCRSYVKRDGTRYIKLKFLHPRGYASHVVHFGASGARNVDSLVLMLGLA
jgi:hypothetical protein